ncbi:hypothetical protein CKO42_19220 [Lamprobacter modestohalophilus]|uniref:DUF2333 family protein n=2 Tax=Lamprobacter modestohalophilus TaxID=1064514 RepID=A0A9X1B6B9_9GAMM|nr:hypothetical protein [Lamprobacter modestohalophilus]MCF7979518.1 DUF2333 family protein [Chromatiaceae bacterium]MCF7995047.1 DUF2333 family protein [Chromatiaceae bacterium]MCF8016466.1 DUF2333 family protein [Chromatiaceae bacterium]
MPLHQTSKASQTDPSRSQRRPWGKLLLLGLAAYLVLQIALVIYWCRQPASFDVAQFTQQETSALGGQPVPGTHFVAATIGVADTLLTKPGGLIHNDQLPPGVLLDNCPSWECGAIMALRDALRALRDDFSRTKSQSAENLDLKRADLQFSMDPKFWIMPAAEDEYRKGIDALERYLDALSTGNLNFGRFSVRADNLAEYLALVEKRLGNFGLRLSSSSADPRLSASLFPPGTSAEIEQLPLMDGADSQASEQRTAPDKVDDVFYCARGYSWALLHFVEALRIDFAPVIADKRAQPALEQIERDLQGALKGMRSPIVLNGNGFGLLANHSLVLASYIARINAAVIDLRILLEQG